MASHGLVFFLEILKTDPALLRRPYQVVEQNVDHFMQTEVLYFIPTPRFPLLGHNLRIERDERLQVVSLRIGNAGSFFLCVAIKIEEDVPVHEVKVALKFTKIGSNLLFLVFGKLCWFSHIYGVL